MARKVTRRQGNQEAFDADAVRAIYADWNLWDLLGLIDVLVELARRKSGELLRIDRRAARKA